MAKNCSRDNQSPAITRLTPFSNICRSQSNALYAGRLVTALLLVAMVVTSASAQNQSDPKYKANVPPSITTPDKVETRIGTLKFFDGIPDEETVRNLYDKLDFARGDEAFMAGMPGGCGLCGVRRHERDCLYGPLQPWFDKT